MGDDGKGVGTEYFNYLTIMTLAAFGGIMGTLMMIPLRRSLIVKEHETLPYPEGTACGSVLKAGEKGGVAAATAFHWYGCGVGLCASSKSISRYFWIANVRNEQGQSVLAIGYH